MGSSRGEQALGFSLSSSPGPYTFRALGLGFWGQGVPPTLSPEALAYTYRGLVCQIEFKDFGPRKDPRGALWPLCSPASA
jgi:hypothetical protein